MDYNITLKDILGPAATLLAAGGVILGVLITLITNRRSQDRERAFKAYDEYLIACMSEPRLASGDVPFPKSPNSDWTDEFYKYEWLVARFLGAAEQVLRVTPNADRAAWHQAMKGDARWHKQYFSSVFFGAEEFKMYSKSVQEIICEVVDADVCKKLKRAA